jgi:gliding motility-associated-like protein
VVADIGDQILDSGVFLRAGSFSSSGNVTISSNVSYGNLNDSTLYEGCGQACIVIDRGTSNIANPDTVTLSFTGTALNGIDISQLPDTVFFAPGQDSITICINGISDTLTEGSETMTLEAVLLGSITTCSSGDTALLTLYIDDHVPLTMTASGDTAICAGNSVTISANTSGGVPPMIYNWTPATGLSSTTIANPVATPSVTTTYYVSVTDSCSAPLQTDSVTIIVNPLPMANAGPDASICQSGSTTLCGSGGGTYLWMPINQNTQCITVNSSSAPTYTLTVTDTNNCSASDVVNVVIVPMPTVAAGPAQTLCLGDSVQLTANATPATGVTYSWVPSNGLSCTNCQNPWTSTTFSNTYTVYASTGAGCTAAGTVAVTVGSIPFVAAIAPTTICNGDSATLNANTSNGTAPYSYYWSPPNDLNNPNLQNPSSGAPNSTSYTVTVTDANGCTDDTTTFLYVETVPSITWASWTPELTCDGYVIPLKANVSSNGNSVIWNFGDGSSPLVTYAPNTDAGPHSYPFNGTYTLSVVVFNVMCTDTVDTVLAVSDMSGFLNIAPANVFTPDNNGMNDCFHPAFIPSPNSNLSPETLESLQECLEMEVWDRWGVKMFSSTPAVKCWNGKTLNGKDAKEGTYYYIAKFGEITIPGYVSLLRK